MATLLLATDGSEYAWEAARGAIDLAAERGATLHVVCVVDQRRFDEPALSSAELATVYAEDHAIVSVEEVTEMAAERGVRVEGDTRHHDEHFAGVGRAVTDRADREVMVVRAGT